MPILELTDEEYHQMQRVYNRLVAYRTAYVGPTTKPTYWYLLDGTRDDWIKGFGRMLEQTTTAEAIYKKWRIRQNDS